MTSNSNDESLLVAPSELKFDKILLEQYKLYVETANHTSALRSQSNNFYITTNTLLVGFLAGLLEFTSQKPIQYWVLFASMAGILFSISWLFTIRSFRTLNSGRFAVIQELETKLPDRPFTKEWEIITKRKQNRYIRQTNIEQGIPIAFGLLYILLCLSYYLSK